MFAASHQPIWDRLEATRIAVLPAGTACGALPGIEIIRDRDGALAGALAHYADHCLLVRPDHYVAACMRAGEIERGAEAVRAFVESTAERTAALLRGAPDAPREAMPGGRIAPR